MRSDLEEVLLGDIVKFLNAKRIPLSSKNREDKKGIYPYYGASGIIDYLDSYIFDGEYLLISEDGENLKTRKTPIAFIAKGKYWVNNHAHILDEKEEGILEYLKYYFSALSIQPYLTGAVQPKLNKKTLSSIPIKLMSKIPRLKINYILSTLDEKIELNRKMNKTLEEMAQALFKSWFVDFDPVHARANSKESDEVVARELGISVEVLNLFPSAFVESELGLIPEGWEVSTIEEEVSIFGGATPRTKEEKYWKDGSNHWATPRDLSKLTTKILIDTDRKITKEGINKISSKQLPIGTILLSSRAPVGYVAYSTVPISINQGFIAMVCDKRVSNHFIMYWLDIAMKEIKGRSEGTTFAEISKKAFRPIKLIVPCNTMLKAFDVYIQPTVDKIIANEHEIQTLSNVRDTLLPKLLSGELDVSKIEAKNE